MKAMVRICLSEIKVFVYSIMTGDTTSPVEGGQATDQIVTEGEMPTPLLPTQWCILCASVELDIDICESTWLKMNWGMNTI